MAIATGEIEGDQLVVRPALVSRARHSDQKQLGRRERAHNSRSRFVVTDARGITAAPIVIVDDVFTTGATVSSAAATVERSGGSVVAVALAAHRPLKLPGA